MRGPAAWAPALLSVGYLLLATAWVFGNPPASAPDEPEHYIRAVSVGRLELLGQPTDATPMRPQDARQAAFLHEITRSVAIPATLASPDAWFCTVIDHDASAACLDRRSPAPPPTRQATYVGSYEPYPYLLMGLATHLGGDPVAALLWARVANMVVAIVLLIAALWLLWDGLDLTSLMGFVLAATPMVVFTSAVVSPSGAEVSSSLCVTAAILRAWRRPGDRAATVALGVAGAVLAVGRPLGPVWLFCDGVLLALLVGRPGLRVLYRSSPALIRALGCLVALAGTLNIGWQLVVLPPAGRTLADMASFIGPSIAALPEAFGEAIGVFGWQDTLMPRPLYGIWGLALVAVIAAALLTGRRREVRRLELTLIAAGVVTVLLSAAAIMPTGFAIQGRYVLPALVTVPLLAGEIAHRNWRRRGAAWIAPLASVLIVVAGFVQLAGWYSNARRYAVGANGSWLFIGHSQWQPPGSWVPWLSLAMLGAAAIAFTPLVTRLTSRHVRSTTPLPAG